MYEQDNKCSRLEDIRPLPPRTWYQYYKCGRRYSSPPSDGRGGAPLEAASTAGTGLHKAYLQRWGDTGGHFDLIESVFLRVFRPDTSNAVHTCRCGSRGSDKR